MYAMANLDIAYDKVIEFTKKTILNRDITSINNIYPWFVNNVKFLASLGPGKSKY